MAVKQKYAIRSNRYGRITAEAYFIALVFMVGFLSAADIASAEPPHNVLILASYHPSFGWTELIVSTIEEELRHHPARVRLDIEYMDTKRFKDKVHYRNLYALYANKARHVQPDIIIAVDNNALIFLTQYRDDLYPDLPIVFCGVDSYHDNMYEVRPHQAGIDSILAGQDNVTGVVEGFDYDGNIELVLQLNPLTKRLIVLNDGINSVPYWPNLSEEDVDRFRQKFGSRIEFINFLLTESNTQELLSKINERPDETAVLLANNFIDDKGILCFSREDLAAVLKRCPVPIYAVSVESITDGFAVGGKVNSGYLQGKTAARLAMTILKGQSPSNIPVIRHAPCRYMFDYHQMRRFGISFADLPAGSIVSNQPQSFYYQYKRRIALVISVIAALAIVVVILLVNILRRKQAERKLWLTNTAVESSIDAIAFADMQGNLTYVNKSFLRLWGYSDATEVLGKPAVRFWADMDRAADVQRISLVGGNWIGELIARKKDGSTFDVWLSASLIKDQADNPICVMAVFIDVTERKRAEDKLKQYRFMVESAHDAIFFKDLKDRYVIANRKTLEVFGLPAEQVIGKNDFEIMPNKEEAGRNIEDDKLIFKTGKPTEIRKCMTRSDGEKCWFQAIKVPQYDDKGNIIGLIGIARDITERKRAEEALQKAHNELEIRVEQRTAELARANEELRNEIKERMHAEQALSEAEQRFRTIFENSVVGLYRTSPDGRILMANPAIVRMLGYSSFEQLAQLNLEKDGFVREYPRSVFKEQMEQKGRVFGLESVWLKRDGTKVFVRESAVTIRDDDGNVLYYEGTVEDITERKEAQEKLMAYQQQLRSLASELSLAEERQRHRIAIDVHDHIGQNLAISKIKLESLLESAPSPRLTGTLNEIRKLIAQTIESSRSLTFELSPPVLYELGFEAAVESLVNRMRQQHKFSTDFRSDGRPKLLSHDVSVLLFQAVRELLLNVAKHAHAQNVIVSSRRNKDRVQITVEDDGVGFDASKTGYKKGGFGLFSIRERLGYIGGRLDIESKPGFGTRIILAAPVAGDSEKNGEKRK